MVFVNTLINHEKGKGNYMELVNQKSVASFDVIDVGIDYENDIEINTKSTAEKMSADDACILCKNKFGRVDLKWMSDVSGLSVQKLVVALRGSVIYQDLIVFFTEDNWNLEIGWKFSEQYLCGNISAKLEIAEIVNEKFTGCFDDNIRALKNILPSRVGFDSIHASLGATWIPDEIYSQFIKNLLNLIDAPEIIYSKDISKWKIASNTDANNSVANKFTYGTDRVSAVKIIEKTMNAKTVKVYDYDYYSYSSYNLEPVLNKKETLAAQEKQRLILSKWEDWLRTNPSIKKHIEGCYNDKLVGYAFSHYKGSFLTFPDLNHDIELYAHQKDAIARAVLSSNNLLLAHEVGSGKTFEMIIIAHELKRMGLSNKNMIVVPNNVLTATVDAHKSLYPNDKILAVFPKDFIPENRNKILRKIQNDDFVAIYMAYSSFDMIKMSKDYWLNYKHTKLKKFRNAMANAQNEAEQNMIKHKIKTSSKSLEKFMKTADDTSWLSFDDLGVNTLIVDEAHNYKNIPLDSQTDSIVGMHTKGSKKCEEMLAKCHFVEKVIFSTGTPLTNSLADLYVLQQYLQPNELEFHSFDSFDMWINTFAERETEYEIDVDGNSLRLMSRFSKFHNIPELISLFSSVCDFHYIENGELGLPKWNGYIDVQVEKNVAQTKYINELPKRAEDVRSRRVPRNEDNLLIITTDGRKAALDDRLVDEDALFYHYESRKVVKCAREVKKIYDGYPNTSQIIFSDLGTPKAEFNIYDALREELEKLGIHSNEIAYVHDATTEAKRTKLFKDVNLGKVRIIIGSTSKLGIGTNVQERLIAEHHLSIPWKPSDITQRQGRIIRTGNTCQEVYIFRYLTPGSFDSFSWQLLENKQRFISSFLSGTATTRDADDIGEAILDYAEIKAACIGNALVKKRVETASRLCEEPTNSSLAYPTPRSWEFVSTILKITGSQVNETNQLIAAAVGTDMAIEFENWCNIYKELPIAEDVFKGICNIRPKTHDALFALISSLTVYVTEHEDTITSDELENACAYAKVFPSYFATMFYDNLSYIERINLKLLKCPSVKEWINKNPFKKVNF